MVRYCRDPTIDLQNSGLAMKDEAMSESCLREEGVLQVLQSVMPALARRLRAHLCWDNN